MSESLRDREPGREGCRETGTEPSALGVTARETLWVALLLEALCVLNLDLKVSNGIVDQTARRPLLTIRCPVSPRVDGSSTELKERR